MIPSGPPSNRPADGLLDRPDLQQIVELQLERNGVTLMAYLTEPDPAERARAALDLRAVPALIGLLSDSVEAVRRDAVFALGQIGPDLFEQAFSSRVTRSDGLRAVRAASNEAETNRLGRLVDQAVGDLRAERLRQAGVLAADLLAMRLLETLTSEESSSVRIAVFEAVGKTGGLASLVKTASSRLRREERAAVALMLSRLGARGYHTDAGTNEIIEMLRAPDADVRLNASYYFLRLPDGRPWKDELFRVRAATDELDVDDPAAMHMAVGIEKSGLIEENDRIVRFLGGSSDWRVRTNAARALAGWENQPGPRAALIRALSDRSDHVAMTAAAALSNSPPTPAWVRELSAWIDANPDRPQVIGGLMPALAKGGATGYIAEVLGRYPVEDPHPWVIGVQQLANLGGPGVIEALQRAAFSSNERVSGAGLSALLTRWEEDRRYTDSHAFYFRVFDNALGSESLRSVARVASALADPAFQAFDGPRRLLDRLHELPEAEEAKEARVALLRAVGQTGDPAALPDLQKAVTHPDYEVRVAAAQGLRQVTGQGVPFRGPGPRDARGPALDWDRLRHLGPHPRLVLETDRGRVVLVLDTEEAPLTVQTISGFAEEGLYDGVVFHRVIGNFVAQAGDFTHGDGTGGPGFSIRSEFTQIPFRRGVVGMASSGKDTEGSQFFIAHSMQPHLDGGYTAFGWVSDGMDVVDRIRQEDRIQRAWVIPDSR